MSNNILFMARRACLLSGSAIAAACLVPTAARAQSADETGRASADSDADAEYVVIEFNALVDNQPTSGTGNNGNDLSETLSNTATLMRDADNTAINTTTPAVTVTVQEPSIPTLTQTITSTGPYDAGDEVNYSITFTAGSGTNTMLPTDNGRGGELVRWSSGSTRYHPTATLSDGL